jgi:hypothetical protein
MTIEGLQLCEWGQGWGEKKTQILNSHAKK